MADANPNAAGAANPAEGANLPPGMPNVLNVDLAANVFNNNRNRGGQNNLMNVRDRLFHAIYFKVALMYAQIFPKPLQRALEYFILLKALLFFFALVYIHMAFTKNPATCLANVTDWPRDGVLRVEVIPHLDKKRALLAKTKADEQLVRDLQNYYYYSIGPQTEKNHYRLKEYEQKLIRAGYKLRPTYAYANETLIYYFKTEAVVMSSKQKALANEKAAAEKADNFDDDEQYIVEYSLEYGHLRLSPTTRSRLKIPVRVVQLDPMTNKCFGTKLSKFLLKELLGYDDLLMASVRVVAEKEDNKGYLRNVITGEHYRFVSIWWATWSSYPTAFFVMLLFTFSISMLLRFSHHQIFVFIVDLLQMLEFNVTARFPIAPLLTVILALVGMEAIMSEFFNDTTTAFYIILIVWIADQYDAICCHTSITKRHWLRFFYLYHFAFYAYHYRFSGQNRSLALVSSWLFIQHSMFYFFHHYELPVIMQQAQLLIATRNQNVAANGQQQQPLQQQQQPDQIQQPPTIFVNRLFRQTSLQLQQQIQQRQQLAAGMPLQQRQQLFPFLYRGGAGGGGGGGAGGGGRLGALDVLRRALLARGWMAPIRIRVQTGNLQRIQLGSIQINPANLAAAAANAVAAGAGANGTAAAAGGAGRGAPATAATNNGNVSAATTATVADVEPNHGGEHQQATSANNSAGAPETVGNNQMENEQQQQQQAKLATEKQQEQPLQAPTAAVAALNTQSNHKSAAGEQLGKIAAEAKAGDIALATATSTTAATGAAAAVPGYKNIEDNNSNNLRQLRNELYTKEQQFLLSGANGRRTTEIEATVGQTTKLMDNNNPKGTLEAIRQANQNDQQREMLMDTSIVPAAAAAAMSEAELFASIKAKLIDGGGGGDCGGDCDGKIDDFFEFETEPPARRTRATAATSAFATGNTGSISNSNRSNSFLNQASSASASASASSPPPPPLDPNTKPNSNPNSSDDTF